ncbi:MAG: cation:proton antiporter, partial [Prevotella sp.]|nr:cation:proton antiporter [Prevotella sp.]
MLDLSSYFPITDPTLIFLVVLCVILFAPIIMGKLRIPHIIGMVLAGVVLGGYGLDILKRDDSFELFGRVGMYYIMFLAGLEMDMENMKKTKNKMLVFGLLTSCVPFFITVLISRWFLNYSMAASLLLGCIMASNTLVAYPIIGRFGLQQHPGASLSVGATMVALLLSLITLAAVASTFSEKNGILFWTVFLVKIVLFCAILFLFIPRTARWFLRRYSDAVMQY